MRDPQGPKAAVGIDKAGGAEKGIKKEKRGKGPRLN